MAIWQWVKQYRGLYQVSTSGDVRSVDRLVPHRKGMMRLKGKVLVPWSNKHGHLYVNLSKNGVETSHLIHRLVLEAFVGPCPKGMECCHFPDRDPSNNNLNNLRWDTPAANKKDMKFHGTSCRNKSYDHIPKGETHPHAKLSDAQVAYVKRKLSGKPKRGTQKNLAQLFGVSQSAICDINRGRTRRS